ncbi:MAG: uncharacterized protein KVP18_002996 [Porospora cf. gigantea A]|uniref:uncharacterized protein n=1 Tax=Porospora cf. gigantea A TaxID=2853593 RepID=UPI003559407D|nr:MAG: hypothetical protein KVP18_002996 [Porospora cf. gigantea A]
MLDSGLVGMLSDLADLLGCDLSHRAVEIIVELCEAGADPLALAEAVKQIRREVANMVELERSL